MLPLDKVRDLISKHNSLEKDLSSGNVDKKKYAEKSKEYSDLNEIINEANIQNWVKKIIGITKSGVNAINLSNPGACAIPTAIKIFLKVTLVSLSGKILAPIVNIKTAQKNQVKIAVNAERLNEVL